MHHDIKFKTSEKIEAWLNLCEFFYNLMKDNIGKKELFERFKKIREQKMRDNYSILKRLGRIR